MLYIAQSRPLLKNAKQPQYENFAKLGQQDGFYQSEKKKCSERVKGQEESKRPGERIFQHQSGLLYIEIEEVCICKREQNHIMFWQLPSVIVHHNFHPKMSEIIPIEYNCYYSLLADLKGKTEQPLPKDTQ